MIPSSALLAELCSACINLPNIEEMYFIRKHKDCSFYTYRKQVVVLKMRRIDVHTLYSRAALYFCVHSAHVEKIIKCYV